MQVQAVIIVPTVTVVRAVTILVVVGVVEQKTLATEIATRVEIPMVAVVVLEL
jgi:hypothetical protein